MVLNCLRLLFGKQGREAIDDVIDKLKEEDPDYMENFESFSRRSIHRLGRLLPDA